jgi:hypothetical protein
MSTLKLVKDTTVEQLDVSDVSTIATSAVLLDMTISVWTGRKRDKTTTAEVTQRAHAGSTKAASVIKNLMTDDADLDKIKAYAQDCRLYLIRNTLSWSDAGVRLLPSLSVFEVTSELESRSQEFDVHVARFLNNYGTKISAAAFHLGSLFNRSEYPSVDEIRGKFKMVFTVFPVPTAGDFRVDVQNDTAQYLSNKFKRDSERRVAEMMREPWERIYKSLVVIKDRMSAMLDYTPPGEDDEKKSKPKLFQSTLDNALELANLMDKLNVTNDPQLADCTARMRRLLSNTDIKSLRESPDQQASVKKQVEDIMSTFDFSGIDFSEE